MAFLTIKNVISEKMRSFSPILKCIWQTCKIILHQLVLQESKVSSWYFQKIESSGYIIYYMYLESTFFTDFKKRHKKLSYKQLFIDK